MDQAKPEMVLFPDADELLPPNIEEIISLMDRGGARERRGRRS